MCNITFAPANQEVSLHISLSQKDTSYVLVEQLQRWYHRDSLLWLQVIRSENDIQRTVVVGHFNHEGSLSGTEVQEGGSLWSKCPSVLDNDFCSQNVVPLQILRTSAMWVITSLSTLFGIFPSYYHIYLLHYHFQWRDERMQFSGIPNTIIHSTYIIWNVQIWQTQLTIWTWCCMYVIRLHVYCKCKVYYLLKGMCTLHRLSCMCVYTIIHPEGI